MKRGRNYFKKYRFLILFCVKVVKIMPMKLRIKLFEFHRNTKGKKGILIRYIYIKSIAKKCGENVSIFSNVYLLNPRNLIIGSNVSIHPMCYIESLGGVEIGDDVSIAHAVSILSVNHEYKNMDVPIKDQCVNCKNVKIENNVWIGCKATILYGRTIKSGSVIGANCVVTHDVEQNQVVGGIPNTVLKVRE